MNEKTIRFILYASGASTALVGGLQFAAPTTLLRQLGLQVGDPAGLFFARHWGLLVFCIGALLIHAVRRAEIRRPVMLAGAAEKFGLAVTMAVNWSEPALGGLRAVGALDGACAVIYLIYLLRRPRSTAAQAAV